jgi:Zn-dependent peptidase ImmA (M78 family)/DNA-binding XRE family transcriptional regulator
MNNIFSYRFKNARQKSGLTLQEIADKLGLSKQMISKYENGLSLPDSSNLIKLADVFNEKIDYFFRKSVVELQNVNFRKKSSYISKKEKSLKVKILNQMENYLTIEDILSIKSEFANPLIDFQISDFNNSEEAANKLRKAWNLGNDPIHNIINLLESNEIKVIEINEPDQNMFDGLSAFIDNKYPVIAINKNFPLERKRFTLFHELAHLLLKIDEKIIDKQKEKMCDRFAGAMLLPQSIIFKEIGVKRDKISIKELVNFQKQFGISISAIIYRLSDLNIIPESKKKLFFIRQNKEKSFKDYINESRFSGVEDSERYFRLVYKALSQEMISISKASALLNQAIEEVREGVAII